LVRSSIPSTRPYSLPNHDRSSTARLLAAGLLAPLVFVPFAIAAGLVTPRYGHIASTFSDSAAQGAPHPEVIGTGLTLLALCLALFGFGFARVAPEMQWLTRLCLTATAISIGGTAVFQDYNRASLAERNTEGYLHNAFALVAVFSILASIAITGLAARRAPDWSALSLPAAFTFVIAALAGLAFNFGPDSHDGLAERILALCALLWVSVLSLKGLSTLYDLASLRAPFRAALRATPVEPLHVSSDD
jgi:hypothetical protein